MPLRYTDPAPRRFYLHRNVDETGISGTGKVAAGAMWPDGSASLWWNTQTTSQGFYASINDVERIHGHDGKTEIRWLDRDCDTEELAAIDCS